MSNHTVVADRTAAFERIFNFRDVGGYLAGNGRTVRWGRVFRSDGLHQLTDNDLDTLRGIGLRTVIDLRTEAEVSVSGHYPLDRHAVERHHLPLISCSWEDDLTLPIPDPEFAAEYLTARYLDMLDQGAPSLAAAFAALARPEACPAVIHCAVGKDRTGVAVALLLSLLGVADDLIVHDYTLSALGMARIEEWLVANAPERAAMWTGQPAAWLASPPAAMATFLAQMRVAHGSAEGYLLDVGVEAHTIDAVRHHLLR